MSKKASTVFDRRFADGNNPHFVFNALPRSEIEFRLACRLQKHKPRTVQMLRLSIVDTNGQRKMVLEGKLIAPWTKEVESAWQRAKQSSDTRKLVIDINNVTLINLDGEATLLKLMRDGARFAGCGVLTKHLLQQLARRCRCQR
jgi:hypothetical protein